MSSFVTVVPAFSNIFQRTVLIRLLLPLCLLLGAVHAHAQLDNGSITGTARDVSGAVIAGASVTIRNVATGVTTTLTTNQDGVYQALALIPGTYEVEVASPGFGTSKQTGVEVHVKTRAQVDFELKAGSQNDTVEVSAEVLGLQTQSADVGNVVSTTQINDLPLNARRYADLALLEPWQCMGVRPQQRLRRQ
ncbi:carboxypeptidase-like regulatory domain-containing protein [Terriglobus sp. YAF25]|uniref:carboxypeptidase-like regulatory domain-containing protein n=1 Tax=Terriglobus sp. YAF25 TaxID=3233080 RepID=UPI003F989440